MYKTIGILGGMGPAATADLMKKVIDLTDAASDQEHIPMIIDSNTRIPDRTAAIEGVGPSPTTEMLISAKKLETAGADFLIIPCNTAHHFIPEIENEITVPILSMPEETANLLKTRGVTCAAVLATRGTYLSGLYDRVLTEKGLTSISPTSEQKELLMTIIYDFIKKGRTNPSEMPRNEVLDMIEDLQRRGAEAFLLACTELPIAFDILGLHEDCYVDPTSVLATAAIREAGAKPRIYE